MLTKSFTKGNKSVAAFTLGIDVGVLVDLLGKTIPTYSSSDEFITDSNRVCMRLVDMVGHHNNNTSKTNTWMEDSSDIHITKLLLKDNDLLNEIVTVLTTFLVLSIPSIPSLIIAQVHTYIGLILQQQQRHDSAIDAFLKALWILVVTDTSNEQNNDNPSPGALSSTSVILLALAKHRLGVSYGNNGNYREAIHILETALDEYEIITNDNSGNTTIKVEDLQNFVRHATDKVRELKERIPMDNYYDKSTTKCNNNDNNIIEITNIQMLKEELRFCC